MREKGSKKVKKNKNKPKKNKNNILYLILAMITIALICACISLYFVLQNKNEENEKISYTGLLEDIEQGKIEKIDMTVGSTTLKVKYKEREKEEDTEKIIIPNTQAFVEYIHQKKAEGININLEEKQGSFIVRNKK